MKTTIVRAVFPRRKRVLITSDLHGHADDFQKLLDKVHFSADDILVIVGDLLEKGPQSLKLMRMVMRLKEQYTVYALMGNVDLWRLEFLESEDPQKQRDMLDYSLHAMEWWGGSLLHEMAAELGESLSPDTDITALFPRIRRHFAPEMAFLRAMPTILDTPHYLFVHGGIPHERLSELEGTDPYPLLKFDDFYHTDLSFSKYVVVGHWPAVLYSKTYPDFRPIIDAKRRIISLDGACGVKREGQINLLMLPDGQSEDFTLVTQEHLPVIEALEDQAPSPEDQAVYIRWSDRWVTVLEWGDEMSTVRYHGKTLSVPTQFLGQDDQGDYCRDATDYLLPVRRGERLYLILALQHGCFVKKDSIAGWYRGRYNMITEVDEP